MFLILPCSCVSVVAATNGARSRNSSVRFPRPHPARDWGMGLGDLRPVVGRKRFPRCSVWCPHPGAAATSIQLLRYPSIEQGWLTGMTTGEKSGGSLEGTGRARLSAWKRGAGARRGGGQKKRKGYLSNLPVSTHRRGGDHAPFRFRELACVKQGT